MGNKTHNVSKGVSLALLTSMFGAGCSTQVMKDSERNTFNSKDHASNIISQNRSNASLTDDDLISFESGLHLKTEMINSETEADLPDYFSKPFSFNTSGKTHILDMMNAVSEATSVPIEFTPDAFNYITRLGDTPVNRDKRESGSGEAVPNEGGTPTVMAGSEQFANVLKSYMDDPSDSDGGSSLAKSLLQDRLNRKVSYNNGSLEDFMNVMLNSTGLSWSYDDGTIKISRYITKTFLIDAIPGGSDLASKVTNDGGKEGKKSSDTTNNKATLNLWDDIDDAVDGLLSEGGNFALSEASGTLTVTDTPQVIEKIESYIKKINDVMTKKFEITTEILEVELKDSDQLGIDWDLVYTKMANLADLPEEYVKGQLSYNVDDGLKAAILNPDSRWKDTNLMIKALSEQGRVSVKTDQTVTTGNGQVSPLQVLNQTTYLAEISVETNEDGSNSYAMTPDTVTSGMTLNILPKMLSNGHIMLHYNLDITTLQNMAEYGAGENMIQLPETKSQNFLQRVPVKPGSRIMLTGFEQVKDNFSYSGRTERSMFDVLGGKKQGESSRVITLIMITPNLVE